MLVFLSVSRFAIEALTLKQEISQTVTKEQRFFRFKRFEWVVGKKMACDKEELSKKTKVGAKCGI